VLVRTGAAGSSNAQCQGNGNYRTDFVPANHTCFFKPPIVSDSTTTYDAACYQTSTATSSGVNLRITWGDITGSGANAMSYRVVGKFVLVCMFRGASSSQNLNASGTHDTCTSGTNTYTDLPIGTIDGQVQGLSSLQLQSGVTLGNTPGDVQRIVLVQQSMSDARDGPGGNDTGSESSRR
jgi:hypothetical protein